MCTSVPPIHPPNINTRPPYRFVADSSQMTLSTLRELNVFPTNHMIDFTYASSTMTCHSPVHDLVITFDCVD